ncbi:phasin family protein [Micromonospora sp. NPDC004704]
MQDAWRAYLELAMGVTESSRKRAQTVARKLVGQGGATAAQLQALAEELRSTGLANREAMTKLVRFEVERALGAVGLATADEVASLNERVAELERDLRGARAAAGPSTPPPATAAPAPAGPENTPEPVAKKAAVAKKAVAKKAVAKKAAANRAASLAKKAAAEQPPPATAKKIAAKRLPRPAKKVTAEKLPPATGSGPQ